MRAREPTHAHARPHATHTCLHARTHAADEETTQEMADSMFDEMDIAPQDGGISFAEWWAGICLVCVCVCVCVRASHLCVLGAVQHSLTPAQLCRATMEARTRRVSGATTPRWTQITTVQFPVMNSGRSLSLSLSLSLSACACVPLLCVHGGRVVLGARVGKGRAGEGRVLLNTCTNA